MPRDDRVDERLDRVVVAHVAGVELVGRPLDRPPRAGHDGRALVGEDGADAAPTPRTPPVTRTTRAGEAEVDCQPRRSLC